MIDDSSAQPLHIESWDCDDCRLTALEAWEKEVHENLTDHDLVPEYV